jgi:light-regulated signal transduction histidine kinase (bacteriophytochrome)
VREDVYQTSALSAAYPPAAAFQDAASGVLAIGISQLHRSFVLWFRAEQVETVAWGGDPHKAAESPEDGRIHPRRSFEIWKETVRRSSHAWSKTTVEAARDFRTAIVGTVLRKAEELAELSEELQRSNKELEAFSYSVSHDLRAPFRHIVGYSELIKEMEAAGLTEKGKHYLEKVIESAKFAGNLVDNLLHFSQIGRTSLSIFPVEMSTLVEEGRSRFQDQITKRSVVWKIAPLPKVYADVLLLRLVIENLFSNAIKYTKPRKEAVIEVGCQDGETEWIFSVKDNGVGFDMKYVDKLFGVFQRLHRMEDFEGTGIGLANVRRIIGRHGGRTWAEGAVEAGATIYFTLPKEPIQKEIKNA